jgi:hypothetical protein
MRTSRTTHGLVAALATALLCGAASAAEVKTPPIGSGKLVSISVLPDKAIIVGADRLQQLVVTGHYENGGVVDLTGQAKFSSANPQVAGVDHEAGVIPVGNGEAAITVTVQNLTAKATITVKGMDNAPPINFTNEIVPIFSKLGCNSGGCHGKASGQNGFKISLLGFEPHVDYESLTREARGRRVFPAAPERSLLLLKSVSVVPHGGGKRMEVNSPEYKLIYRWIASGTPFGNESDPKVVRISINPAHRIVARNSKQQITVTAHYNDGSIEDVTRRAEYSSNDQEIAAVNEDGRVDTLTIPGEGAVMARYLGHVATFRATIPLGAADVQFTRLPQKNFVDKHVFAKLEQLGVPPSAICTDEEFIRRAFLDLCGTLPTPAEVKTFLDDKAGNKREKLIDQLLERPEYGSYFAIKWCDILRNQRGNQQQQQSMTAAYATIGFHNWIRNAIQSNMPYDQFVRAVVAAQGNVVENPPVAWYRELTKAELLVDDAAQAFLGTRIQCARCHHHPFEQWSQDDYWGFASFFARVGRKIPIGARGQNQNNAERSIYVLRRGLSTNPTTGRAVTPRGLAAEGMDIAADDDPRQKLVDWMTDSKNRFFAPALVNRYWAHFFSRGIVEPIDDMRVTNPPTNPELLDALAQEFVKSKFDVKHLIRTICSSTTYQLSAMPNKFNKQDKQNFARYMPKRLAAEVLLDAIDQVTDSASTFGALPPGTRAIELPDESQQNYFLTVFGKPKRESACECERSPDANLAQSLHLLNSAEIQGKLTGGNGRAARLAADPRPNAEKLKELWLAVFARYPTEAELKNAEEYINKKINALGTDGKKTAGDAGKRQAYEDLLWALINTKEFLFNH